MSGKKHHAPKKSSKPAESKAEKLSVRPTLMDAIEGFLEENSGFESSVAQKAVMDDIGECTTLNEVFLVPMKHKALDMSGSLIFMLFLHTVQKKPLDDSELGFTADTKLDSIAAMDAIEACYDNGVKNAVWKYVDDALEGGEGDDEETDK